MEKNLLLGIEAAKSGNFPEVAIPRAVRKRPAGARLRQGIAGFHGGSRPAAY